MNRFVVTVLIGTITAALFACASIAVSEDHEHHHMHDSPFADVHHVIAVIHPTEGNHVHGIIRFKTVDEGIHVTAEVHGLSSGGTHGFHVHTFGDCSAADGTSAGGHYNPEGHDHALPNGGERHAGDLGNLVANADGTATYDMTFDNITLADHYNPILGRGVIIHAQPDDGGQPTGNAGARIGCGVIGVAE